jgi:hypothetical protein
VTEPGAVRPESARIELIRAISLVVGLLAAAQTVVRGDRPTISPFAPGLSDSASSSFKVFDDIAGGVVARPADPPTSTHKQTPYLSLASAGQCRPTHALRRTDGSRPRTPSRALTDAAQQAVEADGIHPESSCRAVVGRAALRFPAAAAA